MNLPDYTKGIRGGLLQMVTAEGKPFFEMRIDSVKFLVFPNGYKVNDEDPDFLVIKDTGQKDLDIIDVSEEWRKNPFTMRSVRAESLV